MSSPFETTPFAQDASASAQSRMELQAKLNGLGGLNGRKLSPEQKEKKLREACEGFESIFIQKMWQEMRNTVPKSGLLQSQEEHFWQDMYDQELSKSMTRAGGIGLADMMFEQLSKNLVSASRSAAGGQIGASSFTPSAAPLVNTPDEHVEPVNASPVPASASIYEGEAPLMAESSDTTASADEAKIAGMMAQRAMANLEAASVLTSQPASGREEKTGNAASKAKKVSATPDGTSGLQMAYLAKREAGDKLGSHAVRPSMYSRKQSAAAENIVEQKGVENSDSSVSAQAANPGSAEALNQALARAKAGNTILSGDAGSNLHNLVAQVQARNSMNVSSQATGTVAETAEILSAEPTTSKVRFTTNIPPRGKNTKAPKKNDVIRMLNVDNAGVNSKAGQGLAAYHAAQEAANAEKASLQGQATQNTGETVQQAPISPLTAQSKQKNNSSNDGNYTIPPLKGSNV